VFTFDPKQMGVFSLTFQSIFHSTHWTGCWVDPTASQDTLKWKNLLPLPVLQSVAQSLYLLQHPSLLCSL
jgi:hypothetical protein